MQSEAHATVDKLEDPVKLTEQGIRDLKKDLQETLTALGEAKSVVIRLRRESEEKKQLAHEYETKAVLLLKKAESGSLAMPEAERLATHALEKKNHALNQVSGSESSLNQQEKMVAQIEDNAHKLKEQIAEWESELLNLKSRAKVASATKKLNHQLANVDSQSTLAMLEKMRSKVNQDEALAESYGQIAASEDKIDQDLNRALAGSASQNVVAKDSLAELKAKLGMESSHHS